MSGQKRIQKPEADSGRCVVSRVERLGGDRRGGGGWEGLRLLAAGVYDVMAGARFPCACAPGEGGPRLGWEGFSRRIASMWPSGWSMITRHQCQCQRCCRFCLKR